MWPFRKQGWKKVNDELMTCYYSSYGTQSAISNLNGENDVNFDTVLVNALKLYSPHISTKNAVEMVEDTKLNCIEIYRDPFVEAELRRNIQKNFYDEIIESMKNFFDPNKRPILLKSLISDVIEVEYGPEEKAKYIIAILERKVT